MSPTAPDRPALAELLGASTQAAELTDAEVAAAYAWPEGPWVRAMMATTLDGAVAGRDGVSGSVSSEVDRIVFVEVRRFADAVLVGAGTLRAEEYTPLLARPDDVPARLAAGQRDAPVVVVVTRTVRLPWDLPIWAESAQRPLIVTDTLAPAEAVAEAREHADVEVLDDLTPQAILAVLAARGLQRVVCEGGPTLLRDLLAAGVVDEADITVSPLFVGTATTPTTPLLPAAVRADLVGVLTGDGFLMTRYRLGTR